MDHTTFLEIFRADQILLDEPMKNHTTFRVGGKCCIMLLPNSIDQIRQAIYKCKEKCIKYCVIGNGSNLIVPDKGYNGVVIKVGKSFNGYKIIPDDTTVGDVSIYAESGILLPTLANVCLKHNLSRLEFVAGIPGTLGGGIYMNAGAYGGELSQVVSQVYVLNDQNDVTIFSNEECNFGYRKSRMQQEKNIILAAVLKLKPSEHDEINQKMRELSKMRTEKQPLNFPSAGSTFKRPEGNFAGKLIEDAGLSGYAIGAAAVSEKHCGFIINKGGATASDVLNLVEHVQNIVLKKFGVMLELEPEILQ